MIKNFYDNNLYYAFFCPNRLLWTHWKEFMGENNSSAGIYSGTEYTVPVSKISATANAILPGTLGDHLGLPIAVDISDAGSGLYVSSLPGRMYLLVYNEWFRDQNIIAPYNVSLGDTGGIGSGFAYNSSLLKAAKTSDYFTRALPYAQKGAPVTIPLGTTAPIVTDSTGHNMGTAGVKFGSMSGSTFVPVSGPAVYAIRSDGTLAQGSTSPGSLGSSVTASNLVADLSNATAATINQLRFAFQYQKMLEKDALYGTRYWEILNAHFGVQAPDSSLQRPELLGHWRQNINIDQVIQTTGINQTTPGSNALGQTAAVSVTGGKGNLVSKSFTEHGYIMILAVARHDQTYGQGVERSWSRVHRTDYYFPVFANLGAQEIKKKEIFASVSSVDDQVFGYQEAWSEYRYKPSSVTGYLRPNVTGLGFYTLANNFAAVPTLGQTFIEQDRSNLARAIGSFDWDFYADFYFKDVAVRPMPLYSVPGLIDHH